MPKRSPTASTELAASDREARTVELRSQGWTFSSIAEELGYADASGASKAWDRAIKRRPAQNVDQVRAQEAERLEYLWRHTADMIENPKLAHSAIGKVIPDPRNPGMYLIDQSAQIAAIREFRLQSESFRRMCGVDIGTAVKPPDPQEEADYREVVEWMTSNADEVVRLRAENERLRDRLASYETESGQIIWPAEIVA